MALHCIALLRRVFCVFCGFVLSLVLACVVAGIGIFVVAVWLVSRLASACVSLCCGLSWVGLRWLVLCCLLALLIVCVVACAGLHYVAYFLA